MLQAVDAITNAAKGSTLGDDFLLKMRPAEELIAAKLGITSSQALVMALFVDHALDHNIELSDIFEGTTCPTSRKLQLMNDIDFLVDNHYLVCSRDGRNRSYRIPDDVVGAFQTNSEFRPQGYSKMSLRAMFYELEDLFGQRDDKELTYSRLITEITQLFDANKDSDFVRKVRSYDFGTDTELLLITFLHLFVNNGDDNIGWHDLSFLYDSRGRSHLVQSSLECDTNDLILGKFVEHTNSDGFVNKESFKVTERTKRELLGELHLKSVSDGRKGADIIKCKDIKAKQLFFPHKVEGQVEELAGLLKESNYKAICRRMKKKGFHNGFACLFYGTPGTGKTETAMQLARLTGRDVMLVDIPSVRSMWVGESEKNVKGIFTRYAGLVKDSRRTPILLFNEADAIIGKRTQNHDSAADKMENTMQNIILQEMENLNGILVATTNLQDNMDRAFERRFLYKIKFERPDALSRARIWKSMIPELDGSDVEHLAQAYDFSGGQIENIARHYTIECILKGEESITVKTLDNFCRQENIRKEARRIGF